jgi:hypothetical protein
MIVHREERMKGKRGNLHNEEIPLFGKEGRGEILDKKD